MSIFKLEEYFLLKTDTLTQTNNILKKQIVHKNTIRNVFYERYKIIEWRDALLFEVEEKSNRWTYVHTYEAAHYIFFQKVAYVS